MIDEIVTPIASTIAGGGVVALVAKIMIQSWFRQHEEMLKSVQNMALEIRSMQVETRGMQVAIENFRKADDTIRMQDRAIGVISSRLDRIERDIHAIETTVKGGPH